MIFASVVFRLVDPWRLAPQSRAHQVASALANVAYPEVLTVSEISPQWSESAYTDTKRDPASLGDAMNTRPKLAVFFRYLMILNSTASSVRTHVEMRRPIRCAANARSGRVPLASQRIFPFQTDAALEPRIGTKEGSASPSFASATGSGVEIPGISFPP